LGALAQTDGLSVKDITLVKGGTCQMEVEMTNATAYTAFQFDLSMPAGISIDKDDNDQLMVEVNKDRIGSHALYVDKVDDNTYRFLAYSMENADIKEAEGMLMTITLESTDDVSTGPNSAALQDILFVTSDNQQCLPEDASFKILVKNSATISIGKNGKTTYCGDQPLDFNDRDDVKAYIATGFDKDDGVIWMTRVKNVSAGVPILVKGEPSTDYQITISDAGTSYYKNMFVGNTSGATVTIGAKSEDGQYDNYYLSSGQFKSVNGSANIGNNKCYLQLPATFNPAAVGEAQSAKIASSGKSSFAAASDLDFTSFGDNLKAFTATGYDSGTKTIWLTRVNKVQKGEGLLLKGTGGETYNIPSKAAQAAYVNMIVGNIGDDVTINETSDDGKLTNYYLKGGTYVSVKVSATIGANKSYLQLPTSMLAGARSDDASDIIGSLEDLDALEIPITYQVAELETESMPIILASIGGDSETTGIVSMDNGQWIMDNEAGAQWYSLDGRRISKPTKKGVYIHKGSKVIIR
jgi:hypothetical protein